MNRKQLLDRHIEIPVELSSNPAKRRRFSQEAYFQETWYELRNLRGSEESVANKTFLIFKPDAAPVRCVEKCMSILREHSLKPVYSCLFTFNRLLFRELWRYELNVSTYLRYPAVDALLTCGPSLFVLLEFEIEDSTRKAAPFLSEMKGPSSCSKRNKTHLRSRINARDGTLNHIHTPEEPLDVLREVGVLFNREQRQPIIEILARRRNLANEIQYEEFYSFYDQHLLCIGEIEARFCAQNPDIDFEALLEKGSTSTEFEKFHTELKDSGVDASWWDSMTIFVARRPLIVEGTTPVLEYEEAVGGAFHDR